MKIVFLYGAPMPNLMCVLTELVRSYNVEVHLVYRDQAKRTPYKPDAQNLIHLYPRSEYQYARLRDLLSRIRPDVIYVAGWTDLGYLRVVMAFKRSGIPVVVGFDGWWSGSLRERFITLVSPFVLRYLFSHAWIPGPRQYELAKRLGFPDDSILFNSLSCDTNLFSVTEADIERKAVNYPRSFLYVGRFSPEKGVRVLAEAFRMYRLSCPEGWGLTCIGHGTLEPVLHVDGIEVRCFREQALLREAMMQSGAFIMPSLKDRSPLAVHEAACAGLPLLLTTNVGNIPNFMINGYNGLVVPHGSAEALSDGMVYLSTLSVRELVAMSLRSLQLSRRVTPQVAAASLLSCVMRCRRTGHVMAQW